MIFLHYIIPFIIYFIRKTKDKIMLYGLLLANLIDLDHLLSKPIYDLNRPSIGTHLFHNYYFLLILIGIIFLTYKKDSKKEKWLFWLSVGGVIHFILDLLSIFTGIKI